MSKGTRQVRYPVTYNSLGQGNYLAAYSFTFYVNLRVCLVVAAFAADSALQIHGKLQYNTYG